MYTGWPARFGLFLFGAYKNQKGIQTGSTYRRKISNKDEHRGEIKNIVKR